MGFGSFQRMTMQIAQLYCIVAKTIKPFNDSLFDVI